MARVADAAPADAAMTAIADSGAGRVRSPREIIELYWEEVWNNGNAELIREICTDPIIRHDPGSVTPLSHDEQIRRVRQQVDSIRPYFTHEVLNADEHHVTSVWNMVSGTDDSLLICGIETFRAENGRFTDCWNAPYAKGRWGRIGDTSAPEELPPPEYPGSVDTIDHMWLQRMFKAAGVDVPRVAMVTKAEPVGNGTTSKVFRVRFGYNADAEGYPHSLIVKISGSASMELGEAQIEFFGYDREVLAYRFFGPEPGFRIPRCYFAEHRGSAASSLVLEDISAGRPGDQIGGCSVADARAVIDTFAAMHARFITDDTASALPWLVRPAERAAAMAKIYAAGAERMCDRYAAELGPEAVEIIRSVVPLVEPWSRAVPPVQTLIHGEPRVDNVLFEQRDGELRACLIDLQQITLGDPIFDLAYFLTGSLEPELRAACERDLVASHAAVLSTVYPSWTTEDAWERYRQNSISGLLSTCGAAALLNPIEKHDALLLALARRNCAAIAAHDGVAAARRKIERAA